MKKCPNCGALMNSNVNFCTKCGTDLRNVSNVQANSSTTGNGATFQAKAPENVQADDKDNFNKTNSQKMPHDEINQAQSSLDQAQIDQTSAQNQTQTNWAQYRQAQESQTEQPLQSNSVQTTNVNSQSKAQFQNYWQWCVSSWKHPFSETGAENWYGWVTLLIDDLFIILGIYFWMKSAISGYAFSNALSGIAFNSVLGLLLFSIVFEAIVIGGNYIAQLFIYGKGEKILNFVNRGVHASNLNLLLSLLTFIFLVLGSNNGSLAVIFIFFIVIIFFMGFQAITLGDSRVPIRDKMYGYLIAFAIIFVGLMILSSILYNTTYQAILNQLFATLNNYR